VKLSGLELYLSGEISNEEAACFPCTGGRTEGVMFHRQCENTQGDSTGSSIYQLEV